MTLFHNRGKKKALALLGISKEAKVTAKLQPHQQRVIERLSNQQGLVVAHGLGSGKTLSSIAAAEALGLPTAVLVPASLQANYQKEIDKHTDAPIPDMTVGSLQRAVLRGEKEMGETGLLIIDEAHRIREPSTKGHKVMSKAKAQKRMLLTASPVYNRPSDIAALVNVAAGSKLIPADKSSFEAKFVKMEKVNPGWFARTFRGIKPGERPVLTNTEELAPVLKKWVDYHENPKGDNFAERINEYVHVPMSEKQQDVYDALLDQAPAWLKYKVKKGLPPSKAEAQLINSFLTTQRQVSGSVKPFVEGMDASEAVPHAAKANEAFNRFKSNLKKNDQHKAVVYSNYLEAGLEPYEMLLKKSKIPYGVFTGNIKKKERDQMVSDYNDGKLKALLVSSAGGEGLDLKGTRQIQILDPHWNNEKIEQVIGRGIRYKSHDHLPLAQRKVNVERYLATTRPGFLRRLIGMKSDDQTADQYLTMLSKDKDALNNQLRGLLKQGATKKKAPEFAPGIPKGRKIDPLPDIAKPQDWTYALQEHDAERAGKHYDLRLIEPNTGKAHSWALPAAHLPEPGKSVLAIQQPTHTEDYARNFGRKRTEHIESGYGKGSVRIKALEAAEVYHSRSGDGEGTRVRFNLYPSTGPQEFALIKTKDGHERLVNKTMSRGRLSHLPIGKKPKLKEKKPSAVDLENDDEVMMPKYDGAHTVLDLNRAGKIPRAYSYRVPKRHAAGVIEHTHKIPMLMETRVPKELKGTVIRTETIGVDKNGKAIPAKNIAGMMNATVRNSRAKQKEMGATLRPVMLDIEKYRGKDVTVLPYSARYALMQEVHRELNIPITELATTRAEKKRLLDSIRKGKHPLTTEGVVLRSMNTPGPATKAKFRPDFDVFVRDIFEARSKDDKPKGRAGGFQYSWTPEGPIAGRVGTGFDHALARDMHSNPDRYVGRAAKVQAEQKYESGALGKASFQEWHLDKGDIEKAAADQVKIPYNLLLEGNKDPFIKGYVGPRKKRGTHKPITLDGKAVGFFTPRKSHDGSHRIGAIYVQPAHRGKGLASTAIRDYMKDKTGRAFIEHDNKASRKAFLAAGYKQDTEAEKRWGGGHWFRKKAAVPGHESLKDFRSLKPFNPAGLSNQRKKMRYSTEGPHAQQTLHTG
jgi:superfamily II DNA or RNA helicase